MQNFEFRVYDFGYAAASVMLVLTRDEDSARIMAERILRETKGGSHIEVWAARRCLFTVESPEALASQGAGRTRAVKSSSLWNGFRKGGRRLTEKAALNYLNP